MSFRNEEASFPLPICALLPLIGGHFRKQTFKVLIKANCFNFQKHPSESFIRADSFLNSFVVRGPWQGRESFGYDSLV